MTVPTTTNRTDATGTGATNVYPYTFKIFDQGSLVVTVADTAGTESTLTITTDYTVSGVGSLSGGNVTLVDASQDWIDGSGYLKSGYAITIRRVRDLKQETDIRNKGDFFPETHEDEFDKQVMIDQQQQDEIDRTIKAAVTQSGADLTLPIASAGQAIGWNPLYCRRLF